MKRKVQWIILGQCREFLVCFDAKECAADTFSLQNLHPHQVEFMKNFEKQNGISFLLIYYTHRQKCYYLRFSEMMKYWERMEQGGPKNFKYEELSPAFFVPAAGGIALHYLVAMQEDLKERSIR